MKKMRIPGIIGGFGPEATAQFQLKLVEICHAQKQKFRPPMLIWNTPISLKTEENLLLKSKGIKEFLPFLLEAAKKLENAGADFIVLPCNTLHIFIEEIRNHVNIPLLSIIDETADFLSNKGIKNVGLLATKETVRNKIHENQLLKFNIKSILPSLIDQRKIDKLINKIIADPSNKHVRDTLSRISLKLIEKGTKDILLACTDLQLVFPKIPKAQVHDTLHILAQATVREILN